MLHYVASDLGLHCLPMTLLRFPGKNGFRPSQWQQRVCYLLMVDNVCCLILQVGMTTEELDVLVHEECIQNNSYPSPLLYKGFPKSVCTSVNNVACHGIPDSRPLEDGDIINVDITVSFSQLV